MNNFPTLLIDDDSLVRLSWKVAAKFAGKELISFATLEEFITYKSNFDKTSPIYIDVSLADGVDGTEVAQKIHALGFTNIYLATGHSPEQFRHLTFLKGIVGKDPPWT